MNDETPKFTPEQELANKWVADNWHTGLKISGTDTNFSSFYAFLAGYETAQSSSAARIEKLEGALRALLDCHDEDVDMDDFADSDSVGSEYAPDGKTVVDMKLTFGVLRRARACLNPEETNGGGQ